MKDKALNIGIMGGTIKTAPNPEDMLWATNGSKAIIVNTEHHRAAETVVLSNYVIRACHEITDKYGHKIEDEYKNSVGTRLYNAAEKLKQRLFFMKHFTDIKSFLSFIDNYEGELTTKGRYAYDGARPVAQLHLPPKV